MTHVFYTRVELSTGVPLNQQGVHWLHYFSFLKSTTITVVLKTSRPYLLSLDHDNSPCQVGYLIRYNGSEEELRMQL